MIDLNKLIMEYDEDRLSIIVETRVVGSLTYCPHLQAKQDGEQIVVTSTNFMY